MKISKLSHAVQQRPGQISLTAIAVLMVLGLATQSFAQVSVSISPSVITLATMATQPFTATVSGSTNTAVTWQVNGVNGGSSINGQVSTTVLGTANEALYLAPSTVPSPASVSVTAISQADPTKSATATVTIQVVRPEDGPHTALTGQFVLLGFESVRSIGYVELHDGALYLQDADQVRTYNMVRKDLQRAALSPERSIALIQSMLGS